MSDGLLTKFTVLTKLFIYGSLFQECDGAFFTSPECYEPESIQAMRDWFAKANRQVIAAGPFLPIGEQATTNEIRQSSRGSEIITFLDQVLTTHGQGSLLYVRA